MKTSALLVQVTGLPRGLAQRGWWAAQAAPCCRAQLAALQLEYSEMRL